MKKEKKKFLWEILVPVDYPDGSGFIPIDYHQQWDAYIRKVSKGLTILRSAIGEWAIGDKIVRERMIPVRFMASNKELKTIIKLTKIFYKQKAVMAYRISDKVIIK